MTEGDGVIRGKSCREKSEGTIVLGRRIKKSPRRTGRVTCAYVTLKLDRLGPEPGSLVEAHISSPMVNI